MRTSTLEAGEPAVILPHCLKESQDIPWRCRLAALQWAWMARMLGWGGLELQPCFAKTPGPQSQEQPCGLHHLIRWVPHSFCSRLQGTCNCVAFLDFHSMKGSFTPAPSVPGELDMKGRKKCNGDSRNRPPHHLPTVVSSLYSFLPWWGAWVATWMEHMNFFFFLMSSLLTEV